jgi:hypothetical protein
MIEAAFRERASDGNGMILVHITALLAGAITGQPAPPVPDDPPLPFEQGEIRMIEQVGRDGRQACFFRFSPASFAAAAARFCAHWPASAVSMQPVTDPVAQTTIVLRFIPEGVAAPDRPVEAGEVQTEEDAALTIRPDGSVENCRSLRRVENGAPAAWARGICATLQRSGLRPFGAGPGGALRRGVIRGGVYIQVDEAIRAMRRRR